MLFTCRTSGAGNWTKCVGEMPITALTLYIAKVPVAGVFGRLRAYYDSVVWPVEKFGMAYSDPLWMRNFQTNMLKAGFSPTAAGNIEYGRLTEQSDQFLQLFVGKQFVLESEPVLRFASGLSPLNINIDLERIDYV